MKTLSLVCGLIVVFSAPVVLAQQAGSSEEQQSQNGVSEASQSPPANAADRRRARQRQARERDIARFLKSLDKNEDQFLDKTELPEAVMSHLKELDRDKDGKLSAAELSRMRGRPGPNGEIITGPAYAERYDDKIEVGDLAPDFTLPDQHGKRQVTLSSFRGKRPVVLIFGSYT